MQWDPFPRLGPPRRLGRSKTPFTAGVLLAGVVTMLRLGGWLSAMDLDGVEFASPVVDRGEVLPPGITFLEDGAPPTGRARFGHRDEPTGSQLEPTIDRIDDARHR